MGGRGYPVVGLVLVALCSAACSRSESKHETVPSAEEPPPPTTAKLRVDGDERAVRSAVRVKRGDLTEEWILSSDLAGCALTRDKVGGSTDTRMRLSWTMATDFATGAPRAINPWWLFIQGGAARHGPIEDAALDLQQEPGDKRRARLTLAPVRWQRHTITASGAVTVRECATEAPPAPAIATLAVTVGKVRVGIRRVNLLERRIEGKTVHVLAMATHDRACNDFGQGELLLMTTTLGEEPVALTLIGEAVPRRSGTTPLYGNAELSVTHARVAEDATEIDISVEAKAELDARHAAYRGLPVRITGRATAHICREADMK